MQTSVRGIEDEKVRTDKGAFSSRFLVDASGSHAVLARSLDPEMAQRGVTGFGLETVIPHQGDEMELWFSPRRRWSPEVAWVFPAGQESHVGLAQYSRDAEV